MTKLKEAFSIIGLKNLGSLRDINAFTKQSQFGMKVTGVWILIQT